VIRQPSALACALQKPSRLWGEERRSMRFSN